MDTIRHATHYLIEKDKLRRATLEDRIAVVAVTITIVCIAAIIGMAIWHW